jgi:hypothetical protein
VYAQNRNLPLTLVTEDNGLSTNSPDKQVLGRIFSDGLAFSRVDALWHRISYRYKRTTQHYQPLPTQDGF